MYLIFYKIMKILKRIFLTAKVTNLPETKELHKYH